ncbi:MAG: DUF4350 domain-containing protein [Lewinellaceae bacterium]|nr:DUF4350 domain-containing protein [Lewinellaceae bacterium]
MKNTLLFSMLSLICTVVTGQQVADSSFSSPNPRPRYALTAGPVVTIDAAHGNFHTLDGRYYAFGKVLQEDGYVLHSGNGRFTPETLKETKILVISNPLHPSNLDSWELPTPSAFSADEIEAVKAWVSEGGRLFLIADHMPFAGAAHDLAKAFGFEYINGFAMDDRHRSSERFFRGNGSLRAHSITQGLLAGESVDTVVSFTGSAFRIPSGAEPIMELQHYTVLCPKVAWEFEEDTPWETGGPLYQGAVMEFGKGRLAMFGEAAMFSAQLAGPRRQPAGMNTPEAKENSQFLRNIVHWLDQE